ncbi:MAG TPA: tRNA pseudouridine(38-40) synthase TruA [Spirochaetota bacterium]|nr:tRNA pseudouridine(38-40) synthase TruA [Spirochaetota bacterium]HPC41048.1 tRNA pseudouridine(38-40) synthase TruA [Spirochaetota bacterium]HPL16934.1 tRNA pseudouridine(38-40) synthase TruA [Spirochaetota bacterium]HQF08839.1 tRNA pseudouridine(38-40) synthase TruA [Spirochaetota bacterium]HQH97458.1 tRNA pseudouridine(38-40) synthase TruA [Spirochaetota bacterium]
MEQGKSSEARRIAIEVEYDGTQYNGWQIQNGGRTVQGEIEKAIAVLTREHSRTIASGRTDSGVHALGQVVHFDTGSALSLQRVCIGLNGILPKDISVKNAYRVHDGFHARFDAVQRTYRYLIYNHPSRSPFMIYRAMWVHERLDADYLATVTRQLIGEKDFSSFCKKRESKNITTVRRISDITVQRNGDMICVEITGNAFLHNMIRIIVGTIVEMNKKKAEPSVLAEIVSRKDRDFSGVTAPPYGLYLVRVLYEPDLALSESAF